MLKIKRATFFLRHRVDRLSLLVILSLLNNSAFELHKLMIAGYRWTHGHIGGDCPVVVISILLLLLLLLLSRTLSYMLVDAVSVICIHTLYFVV